MATSMKSENILRIIAGIIPLTFFVSVYLKYFYSSNLNFDSLLNISFGAMYIGSPILAISLVSEERISWFFKGLIVPYIVLPYLALTSDKGRIAGRKKRNLKYAQTNLKKYLKRWNKPNMYAKFKAGNWAKELISDPKFLDGLTLIISDPNEEMRDQAISMLGYSENRELFLDVFVQSIDDSDEGVKRNAMTELQRIVDSESCDVSLRAIAKVALDKAPDNISVDNSPSEALAGNTAS